MSDEMQTEALSIEAELSALWAVALGVDEIGPHDDFFDLGGHSLLAIELRYRVREYFGAPFLQPDVLLTPTVAMMADAILDSIAAHLPPVTTSVKEACQ